MTVALVFMAAAVVDSPLPVAGVAVCAGASVAAAALCAVIGILA